MGTAWCRERAVKAQDSKSPFDRVIVKCVNQMSSPQAQTTQNPSQIPTTRLTKSGPNPHFEADSSSGWQDVVLRVPEEAPVAPPRRKRQNRESLTSPPPPPPRTPSIHLEVDTPESRHKSTSSLEVVQASSRPMSTLSLEKVHSPSRPMSTLSLEKVHSPSRPMSTLSLEVGSTLSRQKSRSYSCLPGLIDQDSKELSDNLRPPRSVSSMSNRSITSLSDETSERLDNYLKSCRSFGSLKPEDLINELNQTLQSDDSSDSDAWAGLDDWDLGIAEHHCHVSGGSPPVTPTSQLPARKGRKRAEFTVGEQSAPRKKTKSRKPPDAAIKTADQPANFQSRVKTSGDVIKPAQIPVRDFLRHSETSTLHETRRSLEVSPSSSFTFDFSRGGLAPPRSPQIELPGTPNTPRSLSRCSTPLPPQCRDNCTTPPSSPTEDTTSTLLRLLNEYHAAAELIGDEDASKLLQSMGIPDDLDEKSDQHGHERVDAEVESLVNQQPAATTTSSGRSSTNQSLVELETALSEYLEASQGKEEGDDGNEVVNESSFAPIKQEPPSVKPRAKKYSKELNPEITITTATESDAKEDVSKERHESSFVPVRPASEDTSTAVEAMKEKAVHEIKEPMKEVPDPEVKPVIMITAVAKEGDKKITVVESPITKPI